MPRSYDLRIMSAIWQDDDFCSVSAKSQMVAFTSIARLGLDRCRGAKQYPVAEFGLTATPADAQVIRELTRLGIWCAVDDDVVEVSPYKDLIFVLPLSRAFIPLEVRERVLHRDRYRCRHCGNTKRLEMDHIKPWSQGGSDDESNLQTLCRSCNYRKGVR